MPSVWRSDDDRYSPAAPSPRPTQTIPADKAIARLYYTDGCCCVFISPSLMASFRQPGQQWRLMILHLSVTGVTGVPGGWLNWYIQRRTRDQEHKKKWWFFFRTKNVLLTRGMLVWAPPPPPPPPTPPPGKATASQHNIFYSERKNQTFFLCSWRQGFEPRVVSRILSPTPRHPSSLTWSDQKAPACVAAAYQLNSLAAAVRIWTRKYVDRARLVCQVRFFFFFFFFFSPACQAHRCGRACQFCFVPNSFSQVIARG